MPISYKHFKDNKKKYKSNFLVSYLNELVPVKTDNIAYFFIDTGVVKLLTKDNKTYSLDRKLDDLIEELDPWQFDRANRQFIVNRDAVVKVKSYFGGKLIVEVHPRSNERIVVSKAKARSFKNWLNS